MNFNDRIGGPGRSRYRAGTWGALGAVGGMVSVVVGSLVAVVGLLVLWISLVVGAIALFGWWGWQRLRGRQPAQDLVSMLARQAARAGRPPRAGRQHLSEADVVDVDVREVPEHQPRDGGRWPH